MKKGTKRRIGAAVISLSLITGATIGIKAYSKSPAKFIKDLKKTGAEISDSYQVGTYGLENDKSEFSYVYCGDYGMSISDEKFQILADTEIPTSIVIEPRAKNFAEIYFTCDYIKGLINTYKIEGPICINIDNMIAGNNTSIDEVYMMIHALVDKMEANSCPVKVIGHQFCIDNLKKEKIRAEQAFELSKKDIDFGVILQSRKEKVNDKYDLIFIDNEQYVYADKDYQLEYNGKYYNKELFFDDYVYKARFDTNLKHISEETGLSVNNIKRYNFINSDEVLQGASITIPSIYHAPYWYGVDISSYQGDIDFDKFEKVDFAIVRASYTSSDNGEIYSDNYFNHNLVELNARKIPTGAYFLTRARSIGDLVQEIKTFFRQIEGHDISLPVYMDIENEVEVNEQYINTFFSIAEDLGYTPGIYINKSRLDKVREYAGTYPIWVCGGYAYDDEQKFEDMYILNKLEYGVNIFQTTQYGSGVELGINEEVDYDYADSIYMEQFTNGKDVKVKEKK